mmetsp:Transcript_28428/g.41842  ORF Transcript_28428/g.41842 Transcript_28428/m.41842 type:complete len:85 (-) Transcript_28428:281-535(-)|eukprot:CAMPEP_0116029450 /NCGR_PEP_ID=MMETSP0321-20121206/16148_1 /TAXON_ID=163516 /ORGANISM="Leptocylindrus danicus var. danicus, Strain B650" /LENGTH=84 /DNA_ID=CAMNT_0003503831 /DNA_START=34 /DNA_END=288 /DNA_ORIENTATION=-
MESMLNEEQQSHDRTITNSVDGWERRGRQRRRNALIPHSNVAMQIYQFAQKERLRRRGLILDEDDNLEETCPNHNARGYGAPCA